MLLLKAHDLESFEAFKKASRAAASQIKDNTPFCMFTDVQLLDTSQKVHLLKPFLVVGSPITQAPDPAEAAEAILREMAEALEG